MHPTDNKIMSRLAILTFIAGTVTAVVGHAETPQSGSHEQTRRNSTKTNTPRNSTPESDPRNNRQPPPANSEDHSPATVTVRQAVANGHELNLFVDVRDQSERRVLMAKRENFKLDIGPYQANPVLLVEDDHIDDLAPGLATIFLVDTSKSISEQAFSRIRAAISTWVRQMGAKDKAAIISFGTQVNVVQDYTGNQDELISKIDQIKAEDQKTRLNDGLLRALDFGQRRDNDLPLRRAIVLLSDGVDDSADGASAQEVQMKLEQAPLPVYAIAFDSGLRLNEKEQGLRVLGGFTHGSGGELFHAGKDLFQDTYAKAHQKIMETRLLRAECRDCPADGRVYPIQISYQDESRVLTGQGHVRMTVGAPPKIEEVHALGLLERFASYLPEALKPHANVIAVILGLCLISGFLFPLYLRLTRPQKSIDPHLPGGDSDESITHSSPAIDEALAAATRSVTVDAPNISPAPGIQLRLTVVKGLEIGKSWGFILKDHISIGRSSSCDVHVADDSEISGKHCALLFKDGQIFIKDAQSTNGTTVNGVSIATAFKLEENDLIGLGRTTLRLNRA